jgi:hypothetical protein
VIQCRIMHNLKGRTFGRLKVQQDKGSKNNRRMWLCACSCGNTTVLSSNALLRGNTRSCGCLALDVRKSRTGLQLILVCKRGHVISGDNLHLDNRGLRTCRQCRTAWAKAHPSQYNKLHPEETKQRLKDWRKNNPHYDKWRSYRMTDEAFAAKLLAQDNKCACCGDGFTEENKPHVDHDHSCCPVGNRKKCGKCVRDLLCMRCNMGLGFLRDSSDRAEKAVEYLRKWGK